MLRRFFNNIWKKARRKKKFKKYEKKFKKGVDKKRLTMYTNFT